MKSKVRLLALDLDGTLLNSHGQVSDVNRAALDEVRRRGVEVALVTGRRFRDARQIALDLGLNVPLISHNGALTKHAAGLETVAAHLLPLAEAREVLRIGRELEGDAMVSDDADGAGILVYDFINPANHALRKYIEWAQTIHGAHAHASIKQVNSLEEYLTRAPIHIAYSGGCAAMIQLGERINRELGERVRVLYTLYTDRDFALVDVLNAEASKGIGLKDTATAYGISRAEVMAIGDNHNDIEMLNYAGVPVVMANAAPELKADARFHLTATNDADGVAQAIERFILQPQNTNANI